MSDPYMQEKIFGGTIEHNWELFYKLKPEDIFIEVGGYWGRYAVRALRQGCSRVIMVEPSPANIATMRDEFARAEIPGVEIVQKAVGDHTGTQRFYVRDNPAGHRLLHAEEIWPPASYTYVEVDTIENILDSLGVDHVDLLACDNENHEVDLMQHLGKWLTERRVKHFAVAVYHQPGNPEKVSEILRQANYRNIVYTQDIVFGDA
jgi:FkbM family methyltransferase